MSVRLWPALPEDQWPEGDRIVFGWACVGWKTRSRIKNARTAFGQLLAFCAAEGCAVDRLAVERFHAEVRARLRPASARTSLRGLADALLTLRSGTCWAWLLEANRELLRQIRGFGRKPRFKIKPSLRVPFEVWPEGHKRAWIAGLTPPTVAAYADRYGAEAVRDARETKGQRRIRLHPSRWRPGSVTKAKRGWGMWL